MNRLVYRIERKLGNLIREARHLLTERGIKAYWWDGVKNFGDLITPELLEHYGATPLHAQAATCEFVSTGSVLDLVPDDFRGVVMGSGLIADKPRRLVNASVVGVRGTLTRDRLGLSEDVVLGDPGLLCENLLPSGQAGKKHVLGIIPHFVDIESELLKDVCAQDIDKVKLIDVRRSARDVVADVSQCEYVLSSSLHGLIVSDAMGISNAWMVLSGSKVIGGEFKFQDYDSAVNGKHVPYRVQGRETLTDLLKLMVRPDPVVNDVKHYLDGVYAKAVRELIERGDG